MEIVTKKISDLKPYANNPRHNAKAVPAVKESILKFGFKVPLVIDKNNVIVCGHTRFYASKEIGLDKVPCIVADDLTDEQINAFRLVDNRVSEFADWNFDKLAEELSELQDFDFEPFGFDDLMAGLELDYNLNQKDEETIEDDYDAEPPVEPKTKYGDIYQLGNHFLMCGDSTKEEDVEKLMNGEKADMVFCDAPYGYKYKSNYQDKYEMLQNDNRILDFIPAIWGAMQDNCPVYEFCGWQSLKQWLEYFENTNLDLKNIIIWKKNNWSMGDLKGAYAGQYEVILYLNKGRVELNGARDTDIWEFNREPPKIHPTMKPIDLIAYALNKSSKKGEIVLDCFGGSGSTLIACEQLNRKCYMMELDPIYCDVIIDRWEKFTGKKAEKING